MMQLRLSDDVTDGTYNFRVLDSAAGAALKQAGLDQAEGDVEFLSTMRWWAKYYSETRGQVTTDDLRCLAERMGKPPRSHNSWGAIMRGKHWKVIGMEPSRLPSNHGRMIRVYRWEA
jgi:hypothetical protein